MKTNSKISGLLFLAIGTMMLISMVGKSQCNYGIPNTLNCSVKVDIVVYENPGCTLSTCYSATGQFIAANSLFSIPCSGCTNVCNIEVTVTEVGGTPVTCLPVSFFNTNRPVSTLCGATNAIDYDGTSLFTISY